MDPCFLSPLRKWPAQFVSVGHLSFTHPLLRLSGIPT